jgi:valyl-tRNA synthetase
MKEYTFAAATSAAYHFWLYELCDYYLELIKPLMSGDASAAGDAGGDVAAAQRLARMTLYVCLDHGLRLLHPFMPFVTEELWQRLPGRGAPWRADGSVKDPASIMVARYPDATSGALARLAAPAVEADFAVYQAVLRGGRSLRTDADIPPSKQAVFYVAASDAAAAAVVTKQRADLATLLRASEVKLVAAPSEVEPGCSAFVVSEHASIHLLLKGLVDPAAEVAKLEKRADKTAKEVDSYKRRAAAPGYADKVPEDVRAADAEALAAAEKQLAVLRSLAEQYRSWMQ